MVPEMLCVQVLIGALRARLVDARRDDTGAVELTTMVILVALLAAAAIAVAAIIVNLVTTKAQSIPVG